MSLAFFKQLPDGNYKRLPDENQKPKAVLNLVKDPLTGAYRVLPRIPSSANQVPYPFPPQNGVHGPVQEPRSQPPPLTPIRGPRQEHLLSLKAFEQSSALGTVSDFRELALRPIKDFSDLHPHPMEVDEQSSSGGLCGVGQSGGPFLEPTKLPLQVKVGPSLSHGNVTNAKGNSAGLLILKPKSYIFKPNKHPHIRSVLKPIQKEAMRHSPLRKIEELLASGEVIKLGSRNKPRTVPSQRCHSDADPKQPGEQEPLLNGAFDSSKIMTMEEIEDELRNPLRDDWMTWSSMSEEITDLVQNRFEMERNMEALERIVKKL
ncbi:uncharacterized protein LOC108024236 isoform X2 [Drosophila biarmipes]|uniref:uncharacterized protein LOC108024236 isoform X2 n=1 Tax=Drosophila biarmipes TaxID=125945 RepID=UPI0007E8A552|nr:uncharacterized protein LOC108024236 isoform X2 [Drosophila biarmipes]XP_016949604.1 uncharacterized protein LOC108024236 isoform X2 [Drosophila biarmipes]